MKKALKILGYALGGVVLLIAGGLAFCYFNGIPTYTYAAPVEVEHIIIPRDSATIARGLAIATMHCKECHAGPDGKMVGKPLEDLPPMFGKMATLNITQDSIHGIGAWGDGELYYFLRTGIHRDGRWSPPFMPKYTLMADEDLKAVIAWLRSNDQAVAPDAREYPPNQFNLFVKVLANTAFFPPPFQSSPVLIPDTSNQVAYGKYVATGLGGCYTCHSGDILAVDPLDPEKSVGYFGGGIELRNADGEAVISANLTMDKETGIGAWSREQFIQAVRFGKKPGGGSLSRPMMPHPTLTDAEVNAIYTYLQSIPVIKHPVKRYQAGVK